MYSGLISMSCIILVTALSVYAFTSDKPLCSFQLLSGVLECTSETPMRELQFTRLMNVQKGLVPVMEAAGSGTNLALHFKRVEMKISDLTTLVCCHFVVFI